jgi:type IV secretory pathway VirJ component
VSRILNPFLLLPTALVATLSLAGVACAAPSDPFAPDYAAPAATHFPAPENRPVAHPEKVHGSTPARAAHAARHKPPVHDPKAARILDVEGVGAVTVYAPQGTSKGLALFASGDGDWNLGVWDMAQTAASLGYWVAGFSTPALLKSLDSGAGACSDAAAAMEKIGNEVKSAMNLPRDYRPLLIGYSSGATVAYAALAQAGDTRFSGAMTLGFCPDLIYHKPFCEDTGLTADKQHKPPYGFVFNTVPRVPAPWIVLQGDIDKVCSPPATVSFVDKVKNGKVVSLPHVGHGYGVPRNWMPQYRAGLIELLRAAAPEPRVAERNR